MTNDRRITCYLIAWAGSSSELARIAGVHPSTVTRWLEKRISRSGAEKLAKFNGCPLTKEQIRPDIKVWFK